MSVPVVFVHADNREAVLGVLASYIGVVKDAIEEMEQVLFTLSPMMASFHFSPHFLQENNPFIVVANLKCLHVFHEYISIFIELKM